MNSGNGCTSLVVRKLLAEERQEVLYFLQGESPC